MKTLKYLFACFLVIAFASFAMAETAISPRLEYARATNTLRVGIDNTNTIGLLTGIDENGIPDPNDPDAPYGVEADIGRAIAAAIGVDNVRWIDVSGNGYADRWTFLNAPITRAKKYVDVVVCQSTLMSFRDTILDDTGFEWSPIYYYDGTRVLKASDTEREPVDGRYNIYAQVNTSNLLDLQRYKASYPGWDDLKWDIITGVDEPGGIFVAGEYGGKVVHGACSDGIRLSSVKIQNPDIDCDFYEATLSKSPFAAVTVEDDENFAEIVRWTIYALFAAEEDEYGLFAKNGLPPEDWGPVVYGLETGWATRVIQAVGNYGEIFEKAFGVGADRGQNQLYKYAPGLQYAPPF